MEDFNDELRYLLLRLRDRTGIPVSARKEMGKLNIKEGQTILDYGCGIGSYTLPISRLVGTKGKVYALDKRPLTIKRVKERIRKESLHNIDTILSDGDTGLPDGSIDVILLYGVLPEIEDKGALLRELHRILKMDGYLSTRFCFRMKKDKLTEVIETPNLYSLIEQKGHILNYKKKCG